MKDDLISRQVAIDALPIHFKQLIEDLPTTLLAQTPCDLCAYDPPSSGDGKPCSMCPASAK